MNRSTKDGAYVEGAGNWKRFGFRLPILTPTKAHALMHVIDHVH